MDLCIRTVFCIPTYSLGWVSSFRA